MLDTQEMRRLALFKTQPERRPGKWHIRPAVLQDAAALRQYCQQITQDPANNTSLRASTVSDRLEDYETLIRTYAETPNHCLILLIDSDPVRNQEQVIGQIRLTGSSSPLTQHVIEISINLHSDYRGRGLGTLLMEYGIGWAVRHGGIHRLQLEVLTRNTGAVRLYERLGFVIEGCRQGAYYLSDEGAPTYEDVYIMAYMLPASGVGQHH